MNRKLKVYGISFGRARRIVAAQSRTAAARLIGVTQNHMAQYGAETRNDEEVELALRKHGKVWMLPHARGGKWESVENDQVELPPNGGSESKKGVVGG